MMDEEKKQIVMNLIDQGNVLLVEHYSYSELTSWWEAKWQDENLTEASVDEYDLWDIAFDLCLHDGYIDEYVETKERDIFGPTCVVYKVVKKEIK